MPTGNKSRQSRTPVICPYCGGAAQLVLGSEIYPHRSDLHEASYYRCTPCGAQVGCHPGTHKPLGMLANLELRRARQAAHAAFDPIWRDGGSSRSQAYAWLAGQLGIPVEACHIGMLDIQSCGRVVALCAACDPDAPSPHGEA